MRWLPIILLFSACESPPAPCRPTVYIIASSTVSETFTCNAGNYVRLDAIGDGKTLRTAVVCDCETPYHNVQTVQRHAAPNPPLQHLPDAGVPHDAAADIGHPPHDGGAHHDMAIKKKVWR